MRPSPQALAEGRWNMLVFLAGRGAQWSWRSDIIRATGLDAWSYWHCAGHLQRASLVEVSDAGAPSGADRRHLRLSPRARSLISLPYASPRDHHRLTQPLFLDAACLALAAELRNILSRHAGGCRCIPFNCPARWLAVMPPASRAMLRPLLSPYGRDRLWQDTEAADVWPVLLTLALLLGVKAERAATYAHGYVAGVLLTLTSA